MSKKLRGFYGEPVDVIYGGEKQHFGLRTDAIDHYCDLVMAAEEGPEKDKLTDVYLQLSLGDSPVVIETETVRTESEKSNEEIWDDAVLEREAEETDEEHEYNAFVKECYEKYKADWCSERGYKLADIDEEVGIHGECYACLEEFEEFEFQDAEYMNALLSANDFAKWEALVESDSRDDYGLDHRYFVYDGNDDVISNGFRYVEDAEAFCKEQAGMCVIKCHNYFIDEHDKLRPDGDPEPVARFENGRSVAARQLFDVTITETLKMTVQVEADSPEAAEQLVSDNWHRGEYVLDADHFVGVEFSGNACKTEERLSIDEKIAGAERTRIHPRDMDKIDEIVRKVYEPVK